MPLYERDPSPSGGGHHAGNVADVVTMLAFGGAALLLLGGWLLHLPLLSTPLFTMLIYVWSRRNPAAPTSFYMFTFTAAYLPWVMVAFAFIVGNDPVPELLGIAAGHAYYFVQEVLPTLDGPLKGWRLLHTPRALYELLRVEPTYAPAAAVRMEQRAAGGGGGGAGGAPPRPGFNAFGGNGRRLG